MEGCNISIKPENGSYVVEREIFLRELGGFLQNFGEQLGIVFEYAVDGGEAQRIRKMNNLTLDQLAERLGISSSWISYFENKASKRVRMTKSFDKYLDWLNQNRSVLDEKK